MEKLKNFKLLDSQIVELEEFTPKEREYFCCKVIFESKPTKQSYIRSVLFMPSKFNGIFVALGNGGMAGALPEDVTEYTDKGYAVACTDMGTSRYVKGELKSADVQLYIDFAYRSTHIMTVVCKKLIKAYYGKEPDYSYFYGCSAGGLQSYSEVQRYPSDYDGVIAGVPSNNAINLVSYFLWCFHKLHDDDGKAKINGSLAKEISLVGAKFFQLHGDGEKGDNFITYGYVDENTVTNFIKFLAKEMPSLTREQLELLGELYKGPKNPKTGEQIYCGFPIGAEINSNWFKDSQNNKFGLPWYSLLFGEDFDERHFDFDKDYNRFNDMVGEHFRATNPNIKPFINNGGKFLSFSGLADASGPWADNVKYYNSVCECLGGYDIVSKSFKLFLIPGRGHGESGLGLNRIGYHQGNYLIDVVRDWREKGIEPKTLSCSHVDVIDDEQVVKFTREIPPYKNDKKVEGKDFPHQLKSI